MKKIIYLFAASLMITGFSSCFEEVDSWNSETYDYDGRYVVATTCETYDDDNTTIEDGAELLIYNTASNVANEVWVETTIAGEHIKGKFKLNGNPSSFTSDQEVENTASSTLLIDTDYGLAPFTSAYTQYFRVPTAAGQENDGVQLYTRMVLKKGSIVPKGATTIGGNKSDSVNLQVVMYHDFVTFVSYELPQEEWDNPSVPEYAWKLKSGSNTPATDDWDEPWTLEGYRFTGYPEDL